MARTVEEIAANAEHDTHIANVAIEQFNTQLTPREQQFFKENLPKMIEHRRTWEQAHEAFTNAEKAGNVAEANAAAADSSNYQISAINL